MVVTTEHFDFLVQSTSMATAGSRVGLTIDPDSIHIMVKSSFSPDRRPAGGPDTAPTDLGQQDRSAESGSL
jgi:hypothetical protein